MKGVSAEEPEAVCESHPRDVAWSSGERARMSLRHQSEGGQSPQGVVQREKGFGDRTLEPPMLKGEVCGWRRKNQQRSQRSEQ